MAITDLKINVLKRGITDFSTDGFRILPITKVNYVEGLLDTDGRIKPELIPAYLYDARSYLGILDLDEQGLVDIDSVVANEWDEADASTQGSYLEVTSAGILSNATGNSADYEIIGAGDEGDNTFPIHLEVGDYLVLAKYNNTTPHYSFAIVNRSYQLASTSQLGVVKLYDGVDSDSAVLAATAHAVKTAYSLAATKEPAFTKNNAFNKNFGTTAGTVAEGNHTHGSYARSSALSGNNVFSNITVTNGIVTGVTSRVLTLGDLGYTGDTDANKYVHPTFNPSNFSGNGATVIGSISFNNGHVSGYTTRSISISALGGGTIDDGVANSDVVWSGNYLDTQFNTVGTSAANANNAATLADKRGLHYYTSISAADSGNHNEGDIVAVLVS